MVDESIEIEYETKGHVESCENEHETRYDDQVDFVGFGAGFTPYENVEAESKGDEVDPYLRDIRHVLCIAPIIKVPVPMKPPRNAHADRRGCR